MGLAGRSLYLSLHCFQHHWLSPQLKCKICHHCYLGCLRFTQVPQARGHALNLVSERGTQRLLGKRIRILKPRVFSPTAPALAVACQTSPLIFAFLPASAFVYLRRQDPIVKSERKTGGSRFSSRCHVSQCHLLSSQRQLDVVTDFLGMSKYLAVGLLDHMKMPDYISSAISESSSCSTPSLALNIVDRCLDSQKDKLQCTLKDSSTVN
nr:uncharacterized protein LOC100938570 [Pongo abelii]